jgi:hypothetical protein
VIRKQNPRLTSFSFSNNNAKKERDLASRKTRFFVFVFFFFLSKQNQQNMVNERKYFSLMFEKKTRKTQNKSVELKYKIKFQR